MPNLGPDYDLAVRLKRVEDTLARMGLNPLGQALSASQSDGTLGMSVLQDFAGITVTRWYQGPSTPKDPQTGQHPMLIYIGQTVSGGLPSDNAMLCFYPSGGESMVVGTGGVGVLDTKGNTVFTPDQTAGEGLATPWIPLPMPQVADASKWPSTTATSWAEIARCYPLDQHPKIQWSGSSYAPSGTGQVQLVVKDFSSNVLASSPVHTASSGFAQWTDVITMPAGQYGQNHFISVMAQLTSGTGSVGAITYSLYGRQS